MLDLRQSLQFLFVHRRGSYCPAGSGLSALVAPCIALHRSPRVPSPHHTDGHPFPAILGLVANALILCGVDRQHASFCAGYAGVAASGGGDLAMAGSEEKRLGSNC